jgi:hypothetical protein
MATNKQARARAQDARRRAAELRREQQAKERRQRIFRISAIVVALVLVGGGIATAAVLTSGSKCSSISGVKCYTETRLHVQTTVNYPQTPPAGGNHNPVWLNCGIYDSPVPNENAVHDLEHGAVWITYQPNLPAADVTTLKNLVQSKTRGYLDLSPYPNLPSPVVVSAWGVQLKLTSASDPRIAKFIDKYQLGPQAPERGSSCSGGTGTPSA